MHREVAHRRVAGFRVRRVSDRSPADTSIIALRCSAPSFSASRASCVAASVLARLSDPLPSRVSRSACDRGVAWRIPAARSGRAFRACPAAAPAGRARSPASSAMSDCDSPGIGGDHDQHRILRRPDVDGRQRADEILEHPDLQPPDEIAEMPVEHAEIEPGGVCRPRLAAWPAGGLRRANASSRRSDMADPNRVPFAPRHAFRRA